MIDAPKPASAAARQAGALELVRDQVKGVTDAVNEAKDKAESFAETIKKSGDDAVERAKEFRDNAVAACATPINPPEMISARTPCATAMIPRPTT